ncbi:O-antigen polymerase [Morganella morganii]|nr:oligosaccharide repeat unit polymerase [Morganella morganii]
MSDGEFFKFIFNHWQQYLIVMMPIIALCYLTVRKHAINIFDPIHFYFTFTFGTSYAVVAIMCIHGLIPIHLSYMVLVNWLALAIGLSAARMTKSNISFNFVSRGFHLLDTNYKAVVFILFFVWLSLTFIYVTSVSFDAFVASRFEANKGLGGIVRLLDFIRITLVCSLVICSIKSSGLTRVSLIMLAAIVVVVSSFVTGAKFALLESALTILVAVYIFSGWKPVFTLKTILVILLLSVIMIAFVLFLLTFASESLGYTKSNYMNAPVVVELFFMRIFANGDMYYFSLPNSVIDGLSVESPIYQLFGYIIGNGGMNKIFDYDYSGNDIGRMIWKYWYPDDTISRGPTNHFDLAGYSYFGLLGGVAMTVIIGFTIGKACKIKNSMAINLVMTSSVIAAVYSRALVLLLSPSVGIAYLFDSFVILSSIILLTWFLARSSRK